jgi:hypothetical protein
MRLGRAATAVAACIARKSAARDLDASSKQAAAEENPRGAYRTKLGHSIFSIGAALSLFLTKHNDILSSNVFRFSSNCFLLYYIQRMMNTLLLTIESSFLHQNKQK